MLDRFRGYEAALAERAPGVVDEAKALAKNITDPLLSDAETCWPVIWHKPLYANTRLEIGQAKIDALSPLLHGAWRTIGTQDSEYLVKRFKPGSAVSSFSIVGKLATKIRATHRVAPHRMLAIQGAAAALRCRVKHDPTAPYASLATVQSIADRIRILRKENGPFWGNMTILHLLTDFGLGCKPDRHLVRTVRALELVPGLHNVTVPNFDQAIAINQAVWDLAKKLYPSPTPQNMRYLDKILMEISRQEII